MGDRSCSAGKRSCGCCSRSWSSVARHAQSPLVSLLPGFAQEAVVTAVKSDSDARAAMSNTLRKVVVSKLRH